MTRTFLARLGGILLLASAALLAQTATVGSALPAAKVSKTAKAPATKKAVVPAPTPAGGKNLQVFKGLDHEGVDEAMDFISSSLGVGCAQCHVKDEKAGWQFEKDDKADKKTARKMLLMSRAINKAHFKGETVVSCATCHNGHAEPSSLPPLAVLGAPRPGAPVPDKTKDLPSLETILDHYIAALGGKAAVDGVTTRTMKGSIDGGGGRTMALDIQQKAPHQFVQTLTTPRGALVQGFDGTAGWVSRAGKAAPMAPKQVADIRREADLAEPAHLQERYAKLTVLGRESVDGHEAFAVAGKRADGSRAILYFDATTGLLTRRLAFDITVLGRTSEETTYQDYRSVEGVMLPFKLITRTPHAAQVTTFSEIKQGVPVDDAVFKMPAAKP